MEVTVEELARLLKGPNPPHLLDVRETVEFSLNQLDGAQHIPLGELRTRAEEIPASHDLVVYCHHGMRSLQAVGILAGAGREARSLKGGIDAWARQIDPSIPRY